MGATALILAHNHPSGGLRPSESDSQLTQKFTSAAKQVDLTVLDHLIISEKGYFSFADQRLL
ncbi:MAG: JAB domain-containing protein [Flavobacteriaceae bacterium]